MKTEHKIQLSTYLQCFTKKKKTQKNNGSERDINQQLRDSKLIRKL